MSTSRRSGYPASLGTRRLVHRRPIAPLLLALLVLPVFITACGGTEISADEVTAAPPELTIPTQSSGSADALADPNDRSTSDSGDTNSTPTDTTEAPSQTGDEPTTGGTSAPSSGTGAATPQPQPQATATPEDPGSDPGGTQAPTQSGSAGNGGSGSTEKYEEFCQQNSGAC